MTESTAKPTPTAGPGAGADTYVFIDYDNNHRPDAVIKLTGITNFKAGDIND